MDNLFEDKIKKDKSLKESSILINRLNDDCFFLYCFHRVPFFELEKEIGRTYILSRIYALKKRGLF